MAPRIMIMRCSQRKKTDRPTRSKPLLVIANAPEVKAVPPVTGQRYQRRNARCHALIDPVRSCLKSVRPELVEGGGLRQAQPERESRLLGKPGQTTMALGKPGGKPGGETGTDHGFISSISFRLFSFFLIGPDSLHRSRDARRSRARSPKTATVCKARPAGSAARGCQR